MAKVLIFDVNKCNGCHNCQIACKDEHCGNDWQPIAAPQPLTGQFWCKLHDTVRGQVPKVKVAYTLNICRHCDDAPCIEACADEAIYKRYDGIVIIDPTKCTGCHSCLKACPYDDVIYYNDTLNIAQKCTLCAHLLDQGEKEPRCVEVCPTDALVFAEESEAKDLLKDAEELQGSFNTKPRVHYLNLPKRFVAGLIYDPDKDEIVEGASVTVTAADNSAVATLATDEFGDFMKDGLEKGVYTLTIAKEGYNSRTIEADVVDKDINVGDIPLYANK